MKLAFICDPLESFRIYKDSTYAMMVEAQRRGHTLYAFGHADLVFEQGELSAQATPITLTGDPQHWFQRDVATICRLTEFDAVLERSDPPFDLEYLYATQLLELAQTQGARIFNQPQAIRNHNEKLAIAQFPQFVAPTLVSRDLAQLRRFHADHQDIILKPLDGMGGAGIFRVRADELNLGSIIETLTQNGRRTIMAQRYLPAIKDGDKRILLIGGTVVPYCLARIPQGSEVRGNLAAGGVGVAQPLTVRDTEIASALAPVLLERGLMLVGLDVIGDSLTEINVTSPTCFQEIRQQTGFDVAALFIDAIERALQ